MKTLIVYHKCRNSTQIPSMVVQKNSWEMQLRFSLHFEGVVFFLLLRGEDMKVIERVPVGCDFVATPDF